jgi:hypothetical protein
MFAGRPKEAIDLLEPVVSGREMPAARHNLGQAYVQLALMSPPSARAAYLDKALEQAQRVAEMERVGASARIPDEPTPSLSDQLFSLAYAARGDHRKAQLYLDRMIADMNAGRTSPVVLAFTYAMLHEHEAALDLLERGYSRRDRRMLYLKRWPFLIPLHKSARFQALVNAMRL